MATRALEQIAHLTLVVDELVHEAHEPLRLVELVIELDALDVRDLHGALDVARLPVDLQIGFEILVVVVAFDLDNDRRGRAVVV